MSGNSCNAEQFFGMLFARIAYEQAQSMVVARDVAESAQRPSMVAHCNMFFEHWSDVWSRSLDATGQTGWGDVLESTQWGDA